MYQKQLRRTQVVSLCQVLPRTRWRYILHKYLAWKLLVDIFFINSYYTYFKKKLLTICTKWIVLVEWICIKWILEDLALVEYCTNWIRITWGPGVSEMFEYVLRLQSKSNKYILVLSCEIWNLGNFVSTCINEIFCCTPVG